MALPKKTTIFARILVSILAPLATLFTLLLVFSTRMVFDKAARETRETAIILAEYSAKMVHSTFVGAIGTLGLAGKYMGTINKQSPEGKAKADAMLRLLLDSNPGLYCSWFVFERGVFGDERYTKDLVRTGDGLKRIYDLDDDRLLDEPARSPWYNEALRSGKPFFDNIGFYDYGDGEVGVFTASHPIRENGDGEVIGVLGMDALYSEFYQFMGGLQVPNAREVLILSLHGRVVYSNRPELGNEYIFDHGLDDREAVLAALAANRPYLAEGRSPVFGKKSLLYIYPINLENAREPIFLLVDTPHDVLYREAGRIAMTLTAWVVAIALLLTVSVYAATRRFIRVLKGLTVNANEISEGNYDVLFSEKNGAWDEIATLQQALETMIRRLRRSTEELREKIGHRTMTLRLADGIAGSLDAKAERIFAIAKELSASAAEEYSAIAGITEMAELIGNSSREHAATADRGRRLAESAYAATERVSAEALLAADAMREVQRAGIEVGQIIKLIDDIAFQTNILALNASIEAARSGATGKGFAVVAVEVKSLAERSAKAASDTAEVIKSMIDKIGQASASIEALSRTLVDIGGNSEQLRRDSDEVARLANGQSSGVDKIRDGLNDLSQTAASNAGASKNAARIAETITEESAALRRLTNEQKKTDITLLDSGMK